MAAPVATAPSPATGAHVTLRLPRVGVLPATVETTAPGALVLVLAIVDRRVARLDGAEAAVEMTTARGIERFAGLLEVTGRPELVRVALRGECQRIQRREWVRVDAVVPITVRAIDEDLGGATTTLNVSGGGVLIRDPWHLPLGLDVRFELEVEPGAPPVRAMGRVVREATTGQKGVRIDSIAREDEARLVRFVRERERTALRMERGR